jgi:hypothetical protein
MVGEAGEVRVKFIPVWALGFLVAGFVMTRPSSSLALGHGGPSIRGIGIRGRVGARKVDEGEQNQKSSESLPWQGAADRQCTEVSWSQLYPLGSFFWMGILFRPSTIL